MDMLSYVIGLNEGNNDDGIIDWLLSSRTNAVWPAFLVWAAYMESVGWATTWEWYDPNPDAAAAESSTSTEYLR